MVPGEITISKNCPRTLSEGTRKDSSPNVDEDGIPFDMP